MPEPPVAHAPAAERAGRELYGKILRQWNERDAAGFASLFGRNGSMVGFDGSPVDGQEKIEAHLTEVFASHQTAAFVAKVREVRLLGPGAVLVRAVAGMIPPGKTELNPAVNTIHTLVAASEGNRWRVELFQSTPAAFHGRPDAVEALTAELRKELQQHPRPA
jgi:uncharacterized protein (TIGR02246 family)